MRINRGIALILVLSIFIFNISHIAYADNSGTDKQTAADHSVETIRQNSSDLVGYDAYIDTFKGNDVSGSTYELSSDKLDNELSQNIEILNDGSIKTTETNSKIVIPVDLVSDGLFNVKFEYSTIDSGVNPISFRFYIDGELPFKEAGIMELNRLWKQEEPIKSDLNGNDMLPNMVVLSDWQKYIAVDTERLFEEPFKFLFRSGHHTITLEFIGGIIGLKNLCLVPPERLPTYKEYLENRKDIPKYSGDSITMEAENIHTASTMFLIPRNDMSSPYTQPFSLENTKLNILGGDSWKIPGETASWDTSGFIKTEALYRISFRFRQGISNQSNVYRRLLINGETPFAEANKIAFKYESNWQSEYIGDYYVHLKPGDIISLECVLGNRGKILGEINKLVNSLNTTYRQIIMVTGSTPDSYRDYSLTELMPNLLSDLKSEKKHVEKIVEMLSTERKEYKSQMGFSSLYDAIRLLDAIIKNPRSITKSNRLSVLKSHISSIGSMIMSLREQPLTLDSITFSSGHTEIPKDNPDFFGEVKYRFDRFMTSFKVDYTMISDSDSHGVKVWVNTGRDQATILKQLIDNDFTPRKKIGVQLQLVNGSIIEANLAGKGPEVALQCGDADLMNYAIRNALYDLSSFDDFESIRENFIPSAFIPYQYHDGYYGVPETMSFLVMFCRDDILDELGLEPPTTWQEITEKTLPILNQNHMQMGIGAIASAQSLFLNMLYQNNGKLYADDFKTTALDSEIAHETMLFATRLFTDYSCPQSYDAVSRFRTGEMPLFIDNYALYNNLSYTLPELKGLWSMVPIPGTKNSQGKINNTQLVGSTASVMFKSVKNPEKAWEFIKWWTSTQTQTWFGNRQESLLGASGRYTPANINVISKLPWNQEQLDVLQSQVDFIQTLPQIPGSYFLGRALNNAFLTTVLSGGNAREELLKWNEQVNMELERKRLEFDFKPTSYR